MPFWCCWLVSGWKAQCTGYATLKPRQWISTSVSHTECLEHSRIPQQNQIAHFTFARKHTDQLGTQCAAAWPRMLLARVWRPEHSFVCLLCSNHTDCQRYCTLRTCETNLRFHEQCKDCVSSLWNCHAIYTPEYGKPVGKYGLLISG